MMLLMMRIRIRIRMRMRRWMVWMRMILTGITEFPILVWNQRGRSDKSAFLI